MLNINPRGWFSWLVTERTVPAVLTKTLVNKKADGTIIDSYSYTYDGAHNQTTKTDAKGTTNYIYDSLNRLYKVTEPSGRVTNYTFDKARNRLMEQVLVTITSGGTSALTSITTTYEYNEQNRLMSTVTQSSDNTVKVIYAYDDNGNMVSSTESNTKNADPAVTGGFELYKVGTKPNTEVTFYEYDVWNQLVKTTTGKTIAAYSYNGEGLRVSKTINGTVTNYLYEYDKVVLETDGQGNETAQNVYGTNLLSRKSGNETLYYMYNGHGDVTSLLDNIGAIAGTYYYDAFGNILEQTGDLDNSITYAGYQYDSETGLYYLNARYYDSKIARFLSEDTYRGQANDPLSLNLYTYCSNNPIRYWDPTGHWEVGDSQYTESVQAAILQLTADYGAAKTKGEKNAIHDIADAIRRGDISAYQAIGIKTSTDKISSNIQSVIASNTTVAAKKDLKSSSLGIYNTSNTTSGSTAGTLTKKTNIINSQLSNQSNDFWSDRTYFSSNWYLENDKVNHACNLIYRDISLTGETLSLTTNPDNQNEVQQNKWNTINTAVGATHSGTFTMYTQNQIDAVMLNYGVKGRDTQIDLEMMESIIKFYNDKVYPMNNTWFGRLLQTNDYGEFCYQVLGAMAVGSILSNARYSQDVVTEGASNTENAVIGKMSDLNKPGAIKNGEYTVAEKLPDLGNPKANWTQNSSVLRQEMSRGVPIRDASVNPTTGELINNTGFLKAERNLLDSHGWTYNSATQYWYPPTK